MQMMANATVNVARSNGLAGHSRHPSLVGFPLNTSEFQFGGMATSMGMRGANQGLPKLETNSFNNSEIGGGLRTAPPMGTWGSDYSFGMFPSARPGSTTINPSALHFDDSPRFLPNDAGSRYSQYPDLNSGQVVGNPEWMSGFEHQMSFQEGNENAIDESSPSAMSTTSQSGISDAMVDGSNNPAVTSASMWQQQMAPPQMNPNQFGMDMVTGYQDFSDFMNIAPISPYTLPQRTPIDPYFSTPPPSTSSHTTSMLSGLNTQGYHPPVNIGPETPNSQNGSFPSCVSTITENTRQALIAALAQCTNFGSRKYSFPAAVLNSNSPHLSGRANNLSETRFLPSTHDLQRYVSAYIQYFNPHLPFLHIATLSFDVPAYNNESRLAGLSGGRGCLILSMAAIGALYEMDQPQSKELFDSAKKMIQLYLEERRKADVRKADHKKANVDSDSKIPETSTHTPVWLVQAMLLNVVYGHNCADKTAGDIASTHCAALVSLARAAELLKPQSQFNAPYQHNSQFDDDIMSDSWSSDAYKNDISDEQQEWLNWKTMEERKRTLYAVFILCSLLVSAYNHGPCLTNSEIMLNLPCDEEYWAMENASSFKENGGADAAKRNPTTFSDALSELLRTSEKQQQLQVASGQAYSPHQLPPSDLQPSTFGCLILINALHNYIWETRSRHQSDIWTNEETDKMHRHIEPALMAWQAAWNSNPKHSLERPNPYGAGPLSADSIPLLDLAYVRLFVDFTRSKDRFWERDFDGMAEELRRGSEMPQNEHSPRDSNGDSSEVSENSAGSSVFIDSPPTSNSSPDFHGGRSSQSNSQWFTIQARRERLLRKAAFFAVDHLLMSDKFNVTFADFTSRELPLQSAMCAFDCAQVLAEWIATVQERVGSELEGLLGRDHVEPTSVPACMLLEEEDWKLFKKVQDVLNSVEGKINRDFSSLGPDGLPMEHFGWGVKIIMVTAYMVDKAAVWPVTHLMARALETQANHIAKRGEDSIRNPRSLATSVPTTYS